MMTICKTREQFYRLAGVPPDTPLTSGDYVDLGGRRVVYDPDLDMNATSIEVPGRAATLSLRDEIALRFAVNFMCKPHEFVTEREMLGACKAGYFIADAFLAERERQGKGPVR